MTTIYQMAALDLDALKRLAEAATPACDGDWYRLLVSLHSTGLVTQEQADFMAACDPRSLLRLIHLAGIGFLHAVELRDD